MEYRPGQNGRLEWSCRKAGRAITVSKDRAARALTELELLGWLKVERLAGFGRRNAPACYALTMFANDATGDPPSFALSISTPPTRYSVVLSASRLRDTAVAFQRHSRRATGTRGRTLGGPTQISDALKSSAIFKSIAEIGRRKAKS